MLGVALFVGFPWLHTHCVITLQENTDRIGALETQKEQLSIQLTSSASTQASLFSALELQSTQASGSIQDLQKRVDELEKSLPTRLDADERSLTAILDRLKVLETALSQVEASTKSLSPTLQAQSTALIGLQLTQQAQGALQDIPTAALRRELQLVKAMELLTRARVFIVEGNLGLAQGDIQSAREVLTTLRTTLPAYQVPALDVLLARLDLALGNLKDAPALVTDDLEVAWQLLLHGLPQEAPLDPAVPVDLTPSPVLTTTLSLTPTVILTMTVTPTPTAMPTPTFTLTPTPKP